MPLIEISVDGRKIKAGEGTTVAAALLNAEITGFRRSVTGEPRSPLCGMGICFECRVAVDGVPHQRSCTLEVREGMEITLGQPRV